MTALPAQTDVGFVQSISKQLEGVFTAFEAGKLPLSDVLLSALEQAKRELCAVNLATADEQVVLRRDLACGWIDAILLSRSARAAGAPPVPYMVSAGVRAAAATVAPVAPVAPVMAPPDPAPVAVSEPAPTPVAVEAAVVPVAEPVATPPVEETAETAAPAPSAREVAGPEKRRSPLYALLALLVAVVAVAVMVVGGMVHLPAL